MATQQEIMKAFMKSLDETEMSGRAALDEAIQKSSSFSSYQEVVRKFYSDWQETGNWHTFLVKYCGIILDNKDTGAISGSDAGGSTPKGAEDIIPAEGDAVYPEGTSFTVDGLTIYGIPPKDTLTEDQQYIVQGLYSWWIRDALALIKESYGLSFTEENTTNSRMQLKLFEDAESGTLAYTSFYSPNGKYKEFETYTLGINMAYLQNISPDDRHGSTKYAALDRILVHELTHSLMLSNINYFYDLPNAIIEGGTAELIHGIDDDRLDEIIVYAKNLPSVANVLSIEVTGSNKPYEIYSLGYMFIRYFLKQAATDTTFDYDTYHAKVSVDAESFATNYWDKVKMQGSNDADTITNSGEKVSINAKNGANTVKNYSDYVTIKSGSGDDNITNEGSKVKISLGAGDDEIDNTGSNVTIKSGAGEDNIYNSGTEVKIYGETGNDEIENDGDYSSIYGGAGDDEITNYGMNAIINGDAGNDNIYNSGTDVKVYGGTGNDEIENDGDYSSIYGGAGDDYIYNSGTDVKVYGETGNDEIENDGDYSSIYGGAGNDEINNSGIASEVYGDSGKDKIENDGDYSSIYGGSGNDEINNSGIVSEVYGDSGKDKIENDGDYSSIYGGAGNDEINNSGTASEVYGETGNDYIKNDGDYSSIYGGAGNDDILNNSDGSSFYGGIGNDNFTNYGSEVYLAGDTGNDSIYNSGSWVELDGGEGSDYFYNEGSVVEIFGGAGNDSIYNFGNYITISGDASNDYIKNDGGKYITYNFGEGFGKDTVVGFSANDTIKITSGSYSAVTRKNDIIVSVEDSSLILKNSAGIAINFVSATGETETFFAETSANVSELWFAEENNFATADNLDAIVKNNLTSVAYDNLETTSFENLAQRTTLLTKDAPRMI